MTISADSNRHRAVTVVSTAIEMGVEHMVLSPGARNTPLVLALHDMQEAGWPIQLHTILDERSAGFYALGIARRTKCPVLLACTSGSAGTHYYPAVVEASEGHVPLLLITADRPEELQGRGAPQTMPQQNLYGTHVRFFSDLGTPDPSRMEDQTQSVVAEAIRVALGPAPGPVHLNAPFRKPLWQPDSHTPKVSTVCPATRQAVDPESSDIKRLLQQTANTRGIIVAGPDPSAGIENQAIIRLSELLGWPILADPVSQLRFGRSGPIIHHHDVLLRSARFRELFSPTMAITLGGTTSSKTLSTLLGNVPCVHIGGSGRTQDPWQSVEWTLRADIERVVETLQAYSIESIGKPWQQGWIRANELASQAIHDECASTLWEGSIAAAMVKAMPEQALVRLASSMPIRDVDSFAPRTTATLTVSSNRGVNGIDGLIATTLGEAKIHNGPVGVLTGDLSFLHDIGSLSSIPRPSQPVVIVVVDNDGGGIFGFLPMAEHATGFEKRFVTPHGQNIPQICNGFGVPVTIVRELHGLTEQLEQQMQCPGLHVVHIPIDRQQSTQQHFESYRSIARKLDEVL